jgi:hypothetical protein
MKTDHGPFRTFIFRILTFIPILLIPAGMFILNNCQGPSEPCLALSGLDTAITFAYYPGLQKIEINAGDMTRGYLIGTQKLTAAVRLQGESKPVAKKRFSVTASGGSCLMNLPALEDGTYELIVRMKGDCPDIVRSFLHINYPWLGNDLGKSDVVYPPFEPIRLDGRDVQIVLRTYTMNGFGLWDKIMSEGKEMLNGPVVLHLVTDQGEADWSFSDGKWLTAADNEVIYQTEAKSDALIVHSTSTIEYDGCMKVEMILLPGKSSETIQQLWLEIPVKNSEAPLFHYSTAPDIRRNYSGATPHGGKITWMSHPRDTDPPTYPRGADAPIWQAEPGSEDGIVWNNRDIRPWEHVWKTDFVPYIWLGGGTRGIAWFGDSPRDYKVDPEGVMQRIEREGETLLLKVDLINMPGALKESRKIIFGLQASPTRPMPEDWRSNVAIPGIDVGHHCAPWGAHACGDKCPDDADFRVVDELIRVRQTGILDTTVFVQLDQERSAHFKSMTNHQDTTWLAWVLHDARVLQAFALEGDKSAHGFIEGALLVPYRYHVDGGKHLVNQIWKDVSHETLYPERVAAKIKNAPLAKYFEEHATTMVNKEWVVYQDEWRGRRVHKARSEYIDEPPEALNNFSVGRQGFPASYRDFALWYANEWMKRGVSIYIDNIFLNMVDNPLTSAAFIDEEGDLQPSTFLWDQREYHKRIWVLAQEWNLKNPPFPIMVVHHMTNTIMLPVHTWNDAMLDLEYPFRGREMNPFPAEYILAQAAGRQTGSYRHLLGSTLRIPGGAWFRESISEMDPDIIRTEWGMRMVHEAMRWMFPHENYAVFEPARTLEKKLWDFGYGTDDCIVSNYWDDDPPVQINNPQVKWLLVSRKSDATIFLVLQSYLNEDTSVEVQLDENKLGFSPVLKAYEVASNTSVKVERSDNLIQLKSVLKEPFGTKVVIIGSGS